MGGTACELSEARRARIHALCGRCVYLWVAPNLLDRVVVMAYYSKRFWSGPVHDISNIFLQGFWASVDKVMETLRPD